MALPRTSSSRGAGSWPRGRWQPRAAAKRSYRRSQVRELQWRVGSNTLEAGGARTRRGGKKLLRLPVVPMKAVAEVARIECRVFRRAGNTPAPRVRDLHTFVRLAKVRIMLKRLVASSSLNALMRARRVAQSAFLRPGWQNLRPKNVPTLRKRKFQSNFVAASGVS